jgi:hypothetical protein
MVNRKNIHTNLIPLFRLEGWDFFIFLQLALVFLFIGTQALLSGQVSPVVVGNLPSIISEASGLQCTSPGICYTFNDSNDDSRLYRISEGGTFISQLVIQGVPHIDYEDIAYASDGRLFIGDFGNNNNDRQDLAIHILTEYEGSVTVPTTIEFSYEDQSEFPPGDEAKNFDVEAMIHWQDSLFLFTRNRTSPFNGITKIYALSDAPGVRIAQLRGELFGNLSEIHSSVTAADISPSGNRIAWLTRGSLYLFTSPGNMLSNETPTYNFFAFSRDYEGVSFIDDCNLLLVEEGDAASIYSLSTCDVVTEVGIQYNTDKVRIRQANQVLYLQSDSEINSVAIYDNLGRRMHYDKYRGGIGLSNMSTGSYIVLIDLEGITYPHRINIIGD